MEHVKVFNQEGVAEETAVGAFARVLMELWPDLPVEDEARLDDPALRDRFVEQISDNHRRRTQRPHCT